MTSLTPYDALLVVSYGGPRGPEDVLPFLRNATRGRGIPDERLAVVGEHYSLFGGVSPINDRNAELMDALRSELARCGVEIPIAIGNRNWTPYLADTLAGLKASGAKRVLCLVTSAYASYSSCRQYREDLARALDAVGGGVQLDKIGPFFGSAGFVQANADAVVAALEPLVERGKRVETPRVLFVTHSIPQAMEAMSGTASEGARETYRAQHLRVAEAVIDRVSEATGVRPEWELVYCSRSGAPHIPWLEPDINDRLAELDAEGVQAVVASPIGFVNDHMEVVYDLDTQAAETAAGLGLAYARAATAGTHPAFVASLVDELVERAAVARGEAKPRVGVRYECPSDCCLGRPGAAPVPTACSASE